MTWFDQFAAAFRQLLPAGRIGDRGEIAARRFLQRQGMKIVAQRHRNAYAEIDLIAVDGETVVFVEVKTRQSNMAGHPTESVDLDKQTRLSRAAMAYLKQHDLLEYSSRFDVLAVNWPADDKQPEINHYRDAFPPVAEGQLFS